MEPKTHLLKLTKGARSLALSLLSIPDQFKTLPELKDALSAAEVLGTAEHPPTGDALNIWVSEPSHVEVTEAQRDILKGCCKNHTSKLPINTHTLLLLTELGLT